MRILFILLAFLVSGCSNNSCPNNSFVKNVMQLTRMCHQETKEAKDKANKDGGGSSPILNSIGYFLIDRVYASSVQIPACNSTYEGKLIYVQDERVFKVYLGGNSRTQLDKTALI